jgi:hypothetical protein
METASDKVPSSRRNHLMVNQAGNSAGKLTVDLEGRYLLTETYESPRSTH